MNKVTIYTGAHCPYCLMAKRLLNQLGVQDICEITRDEFPEEFRQVQIRTGQRTIPQIFIGDNYVGGFTDLYALHQQGSLQTLLNVE